jgi:hypothetical protein
MEGFTYTAFLPLPESYVQDTSMIKIKAVAKNFMAERGLITCAKLNLLDIILLDL